MYSIIKNYLFMAFFGALSILAMAFFVSALIYPTLPNISHLEKYRPKHISIFGRDIIINRLLALHIDIPHKPN